MANKMTPGPWGVSDGDIPQCIVFDAKTHSAIAWLYDEEMPVIASHAEIAANARAIAALPDLIEASKPIAETLSGSSDDMKDTFTISITVGELRALRAALAKAEGKS